MSLRRAAFFRTCNLLGRAGLGRPVARVVFKGLVRQWPAIKTAAFADYTPRKGDVIVATYAKSGTNWMLQITQQIAWRGAAEFDHIHHVAPWPDAPRLHDETATLDSAPPGPTGLRVIKTHCEAQYVPMHDDLRTIVVLRDPSDVFVSGYHFFHTVIRGVGEVRFTPEEWVELTLRNEMPLCSWAEFTASWWPLRDRPNVLFVTFAELKQDLGAAVTRIAEFLGVELTEAEHAAVVERSSFAWMKEHEHQFLPMMPRLRDEPAVMLRAGRQGDGRQLLDDDQLARLQRFWRAELVRLGCDYPYEPA